jgi:phosphoribosylanthranilate isomerase
MIVKVCGVRSGEVAEIAVDAGADWIGLVFEPRSPRHADDAAADTVRAAVQGRADLVGVMVAPAAEACAVRAVRHRLHAVQLHGEVAPDIVEAVPVPVIRGINLGGGRSALRLEWWPDGLVLLDGAPRDGELPGGNGRRVDWEIAAEVAAHRRIILAGGLTPDNVAEAIARVRPYGVDASSGLESAPGVKDPVMVRAYVEAARAAFGEHAAELPEAEASA